jgi:hypothetical protein
MWAVEDHQGYGRLPRWKKKIVKSELGEYEAVENGFFDFEDLRSSKKKSRDSSFFLFL